MIASKTRAAGAPLSLAARAGSPIPVAPPAAAALRRPGGAQSPAEQTHQASPGRSLGGRRALTGGFWVRRGGGRPVRGGGAPSTPGGHVLDAWLPGPDLRAEDSLRAKATAYPSPPASLPRAGGPRPTAYPQTSGPASESIRAVTSQAPAILPAVVT